MSDIDYYQILGVNPTATQAEIRAAYKRLALEYHPDRSGSPQSTQMMQQINEAYQVLRDESKRAEYDSVRQLPMVYIPVIPSYPPVPVQRPKPRRKIDPRKRRRRLISLLVFMFQMVMVTLGLFIWALFSGQVNWLLLAAVVVVALSLMVSLVSMI